MISRRRLLQLLAAAIPASRARSVLGFGQEYNQIRPGPFKGTRESLAAYSAPQWFRDAKFGIWAHWGPQSAIEYGDWYARLMYIQGERQYKYHVEHYGHPSKFGYKDTIPSWKAEKFDPDYLLGLYKKAGAKYFVSMGVHHDNFDLWNSKHTRWNSVNMGPHKDIVGMFRNATAKQGLRFGVSEHLAMSYKWFSVAHGSDKEGTLASVPYDGQDPKYADLYHDIKDVYTKLEWNLDGTSEAFKRHWFMRIKDLVDNYEPDLLYTDGLIPFENWGLSLVAHFYNVSRKGSSPQGVYTSKRLEDCRTGTCVLDVERGVVDQIWPEPWQTDTCIGNWHYLKGATYKTPKMVIDMLVDIVSRNGNLLLNFPLPSSGMLDQQELKILDEITRWMAVNQEAIHETRPWKIYGEGPSTQVSSSEPGFNESKRKPLGAKDIRFTKKGQTLYAFFMGWPEGRVSISALGPTSKLPAGKIGKVELLGSKHQLKWAQDAEELTVELPVERPCEHACVLRIGF
ncbi:MAG TPA: alpha-L-fucosidase [Blastocatellia bacterium]|nr:alpha-L-fucosidase [Blastocatellia bacterium]